MYRGQGEWILSGPLYTRELRSLLRSTQKTEKWQVNPDKLPHKAAILRATMSTECWGGDIWKCAWRFWGRGARVLRRDSIVSSQLSWQSDWFIVWLSITNQTWESHLFSSICHCDRGNAHSWATPLCLRGGSPPRMWIHSAQWLNARDKANEGGRVYFGSQMFQSMSR